MHLLGLLLVIAQGVTDSSILIGMEGAAQSFSTDEENLGIPTLLIAGSMSGADALAGIPIEGSIVVYLAEIGADGQLDRATRHTVLGIARQRPNALLVVGDPSEQAWADRAQRQLRPSLRLASPRRSTPILLVRASAIDAVLTEHLGGSTAFNGTSGLEHPSRRRSRSGLSPTGNQGC